MAANILSRLAGWRGYAAAFLAGGLMLGAAGWAANGWRMGAQLAEERTSHATVMEEHARAALIAVQAARDEEQRRVAALEDARDEWKKMAATSAAAAGRARAERDGLLARADSLVADARSRDPALAGGGPPGDGPLDLLADLLGRAVERSVQLAAIADGARAAGLTCERAYDSLR